MHLNSAVLAAASIAIQQVTATGGSYGGAGWGGHTYYSTPDITDNKCSTNQTKGYDWADLSSGSFNSYGSNKFSGWSCSNSFGKRDLLTKRTFQSKCITSNLDDEPAVDCDGDDKMSIKTYQVSSDQDDDVDIECHYTMPDESICREVHSCASTGSIITNTQCGGAKKVTFKPHGKSKGKGCNIGVHSIEFDCETASVPPGYSTTSAAVSSYSQPPAYTSSSIPSAVTTSASGYDTTSSQAPPQYSSTTQGGSQYSSSQVASSYSSPTSVESSPVTPSAPVYSTVPGYSNSSAVEVPGYGSSSSQTSTAPVETTPSYPTPESPDVLPKCINSWLHLTECKGNTDYECFCKNSALVSKVYDCVSAWSDSENDTNSGAGYFMGICAKYVPENPAIITGCPSTITPATKYNTPASTPNSPVTAQPPAYTGATKATRYSTIISTITSCGPDVTACPAASTYIQSSTEAVTTSTDSSPTAIPCTTITYSSALTLPATSSSPGANQGPTVPSSNYTTTSITTVTVPLLQITTYTVTESGSTRHVPGLGYETPGPAPVAPSPPLSSSASSPSAPYPTPSVPGPVVGHVEGGGGSSISSLGTTYFSRPTSSTITPYTGGGDKYNAGGGGGVAVVFAFAVVVLLY